MFYPRLHGSHHKWEFLVVYKCLVALLQWHYTYIHKKINCKWLYCVIRLHFIFISYRWWFQKGRFFFFFFLTLFHFFFFSINRLRKVWYTSCTFYIIKCLVCIQRRRKGKKGATSHRSSSWKKKKKISSSVVKKCLKIIINFEVTESFFALLFFRFPFQKCK